MFAVEHRYYGCHNASACPYTPADPEPLKWLSSRQALADLATFHAHATAAYDLDRTKNKWVSFGGSYPGMLAGWFRVLYPQLVHASVASSAPVNAKLEMKEYNDIAARAYSLGAVGGSDACRAAIADGHATIGSMMNTSAGRDKLASLFPQVKLHAKDWLTTHEGRLEFAGNGVVYFPSQGLDYWGWQTCTEFGFYQTCEIGSICFYTQGLNLLPDMDGFCKVDYGIAQEQIARSIDATNAFYGADRPDLAHNASRIMYVNGDVDPWSALSILKALSKDLPTLIVQGASHHAWTHPTYSTDQASVVTARRMIRQQVSAWLAEA